ncbi:polysaccharide biosynthesis C-terminal domain-containing protein [Hymenobacter sp. ASUV-10]|uniref:Polysaccharide biosynthesis C-terminal domain-containing protein n=1 Tax=Hymenobacter aranciens TaxID=3063996 RepID=A0ABT9BBQ3_9BACT|nr:polysaccharide biosynthesis C-terminal domain-containing protein [Hymenobacter sp. ASUV-10]MDO7875124.1 polysaccharide biosynthesis C-terminal domain-containing protein [Hymenobacter sp. ASUV-10]
MSVLKKLAGQTAVYGVSSIVGRVLTYLLVPVYTAYFAAAEYGIVTGLYAYVSFLNVVFTYGMETTFFRFANRPGADRRELYDRVLSLLLVSTVVLTVLLALLARPLLSLLEIPPGHEQYAIWIALILGLDTLTAIPFARLRLENKARRFAGIKLAGIVLNVGLNLFFIVFCPCLLKAGIARPLVEAIYNPGLGVGYVFLANLFASAATLLLLGRELLDFRFRFNLGWLRPLLAYAFPLMLMGLAGMVNETLDRILLPKWLPEGFYPGKSSLTAVGIYGACYKLSIFMSLVIQAFRYAAEPFFFAQSTEKNSPATFAMILKWFTICCAIIFVGISLNAEDFGAVFLRRPEYREGLAVVPVLLLANLFLGVYYNLSVWFKLTDKTYYGTYIGAGGAVLTIVLNFVLIPVLGYMGSALATLACYFLMAVLCWRLGERHFPVPYPMARLGLWLLLAAVLVAVGWQVKVSDWWLRHAWHMGLTVLFLVALYVVERPQRAVR